MTLQEIEESIGEGLELELYTPEMKTSFGITMSDARPSSSSSASLPATYIPENLN